MLVKLARRKACTNVNAKMKSVFCYIYTAVHSRTLDKGGIKSEKNRNEKTNCICTAVFRHKHVIFSRVWDEEVHKLHTTTYGRIRVFIVNSHELFMQYEKVRHIIIQDTLGCCSFIKIRVIKQ